MKIVTTYTRNNPDTINGYSITLVRTISSYDKEEIDLLEWALREQYGTVNVVDTCKKETEDE